MLIMQINHQLIKEKCLCSNWIYLLLCSQTQNIVPSSDQVAAVLTLGGNVQQRAARSHLLMPLQASLYMGRLGPHRGSAHGPSPQPHSGLPSASAQKACTQGDHFELKFWKFYHDEIHVFLKLLTCERKRTK